MPPTTVDGFYEAWRVAPTKSRLIALALLVSTLLPPAYLFVMIQYGAITLPLGDHFATAKLIIKYFDGSLTFRDLLEPQAQARPLFPRLIFIANAALTNWDIRSEYYFIFLTVYGTLAALIFSLLTITQRQSKTYVLLAALLISIVVCSPVAAMNHWWSLMLLATLSYMCALMAFLLFSIAPMSWLANAGAAFLGWIGAYSISQGLFVFPVIAIIHLIISQRVSLPSRHFWFWAINMFVCFALYLPGVPMSNGPRPTLEHFLGFVLVYIGSPLGSLLWFPELGAIDIPSTSYINGAAGLGIIFLTIVTAWHLRSHLASRRPEALIFFTFASYAVACTLVTAWGRAFGSYAIAGANSGRYSIFAACFLFGLVFAYAPRLRHNGSKVPIWVKGIYASFVVLSIVSYVRGVAVYRGTHQDNEWLSDVYTLDGTPTVRDLMAFPDEEYMRQVRNDLLRLGIGPYRSVSHPLEAIYSGRFAGAVPFLSGTIIKQRFKTIHPVIRSVSFLVVNWGNAPSHYSIRWNIVGLKGEVRTRIGEGEFWAPDWMDWRTETIRLDRASGQDEFEVTFFTEEGAAVDHAVGLCLFPPGSDPNSPAVIDGKPQKDGNKIGLLVSYY